MRVHGIVVSWRDRLARIPNPVAEGRKRRSCASVLLLSCLGVGAAACGVGDTERSAGSADSIATTGDVQFSDWSAPTNLNAVVLSDGTPCPPVVNSEYVESHPAISKDGLTLVISTTRPRPGPDGLEQVGDLWFSKRDSLDSCWQPPFYVEALNSPALDAAPNLTTDGHWLFFHSKRTAGSCDPGAPPHSELWVSHRQDASDDFGWEAPINLGCAGSGGINVTYADNAGPNLFEDESGKLFLYSTRNQFPGDSKSFDIYVSTCDADLATCNTQGLWGPGTPVDSLNSSSRDTRTAIRRRDGLEMIFSTGRPGGIGSEDLWVSTRATTSDDWSMPVPLGQPVNSTAFDGAPALSWDGTELYFFSERTDLTGFAGGRDLYVSRRTRLTGH